LATLSSISSCTFLSSTAIFSSIGTFRFPIHLFPLTPLT
jgi:hypothetical protein